MRSSPQRLGPIRIDRVWPLFLYPFWMACALIAAALLLRRRQAALAIDPYDRGTLAFAACCGAMFGGKGMHAIMQWLSLTSVAPNNDLAIDASWAWIDGKTILGGIFGGYLAVEATKWFNGIRIKTGDSYAIPVAVAVAFGRIACFTAGCCYGTVTLLPWGIHFPRIGDADDVFRHPTQLYEVAFHAASAGGLLLAESHDWCKGQRLKAYLIAYLVYRIITESIRPEPVVAFGTTAYQWISVGLIAILVGLWICDRRYFPTPSGPQ
jgi:phosphatidylglycerol---prolipoprotein diacylglyceryl transferase